MRRVFETELTRRVGCRCTPDRATTGSVARPGLVTASCDPRPLRLSRQLSEDPRRLREAIGPVKAATAHPFSVNFQMLYAGAPEIVDAALGHRDPGSCDQPAMIVASASMLDQNAAVEGDPDEALMATSPVAGRTTDLPRCPQPGDSIAEQTRAGRRVPRALNHADWRA